MSTLTNCSSGRRRANCLDAPDRLGAVHGRGLDHPERALDQIAVRQVLLHELGVAEDRLQEVVEVVGDAAGQPAQRGELLRLMQLVFDLPLRGDVADDGDEAVESRPDAGSAGRTGSQPA